MYPVGTVWYCPVHPSNNISLGALKCYVGIQKSASEPLFHFNFVYPQDHSLRSPYRSQSNLDYLQIEFVKVNPQINKDILFLSVCGLSKQNIY